MSKPNKVCWHYDVQSQVGDSSKYNQKNEKRPNGAKWEFKTKLKEKMYAEQQLNKENEFYWTHDEFIRNYCVESTILSTK